MRTVLVLQHFPVENLGIIVKSFERRGIAANYVRLFDGEPVPSELPEGCGLIVMGGPMGVYEIKRFPFLLDEMRLIEHAVARSLPVLGVCLGSQLLATVLGAEIVRGKQKELGWRTIDLMAEAERDPLWRGVCRRFVAFHWHGDIFDLPPGSVLLASSELTTCQAFRYGSSAYGLLFHLEVTEEMVASIATCFCSEAQAAGVDGGEIVSQSDLYLRNLHSIGDRVFDRWTRLA